jgi:hypothetical protein
VIPGVSERDLESLARAIRRVILGALVDRHADLAETREQLRTQIEAYAARATRQLTGRGASTRASSTPTPWTSSATAE